MVDSKYKAIYNTKIKYIVMTADKWTYAEKHNSKEEAQANGLLLGCDFFIVETFPGFQKYPVYNDNVK